MAHQSPSDLAKPGAKARAFKGERPRIDRQLRPVARLTGDAFDFDSPIIDFRNLQLEQLDYKLRVRPRENDGAALKRHIDPNTFTWFAPSETNPVL